MFEVRKLSSLITIYKDPRNQKVTAMRKKLITLLFTIACYSGWGQVTLPHYDGFSYTVGQSLTTQSGWSLLNGQTSDLLITSGSLSYSGYSNANGEKISFSGSGEDAAKTFTQTTSGKIYVSLLMNITSLGSLNATGGYFFGLAEGAASTTYGATIWLKSNGSGYQIGVNPRTTSTNTVWNATQLVLNTTYHVCVSYEIISGSTNDIVSLWINPQTGGSEPQADITTTNGITDLVNLNRILIRQDNTTATPSIDLDEIHIGTTWSNSVVMPVLLSSFNCEKIGKTNELNWSTESEQNNSGFEIQRSTDAVNFEKIGFVKSLSATGNSSSRLDYTFTDYNPVGLRQYYRLKQTDFDGTSKYSAVVLVTREAPTALQLTHVYPNPSRESLYINTASPTKMELQLLVIDLGGRVVGKKQVSAEIGNNGFDIPVAHLASGTYILKVLNSSQQVVATEKFIKQ